MEIQTRANSDQKIRVHPPAVNIAMADRVARALSRRADPVFLEALSDRDHASLSDLIEEYFCGSSDDTG